MRLKGSRRKEETATKACRMLSVGLIIRQTLDHFEKVTKDKEKQETWQ